MKRKLLFNRRSLLVAAPAVLLTPRRTLAAEIGSGLPDGFSGAPFGTAQYPTLLNRYAKRPPWHVAGVDYYVGCPTNQSFGANVAVSGGLNGTSFTPAFVNACNAFGGFV